MLTVHTHRHARANARTHANACTCTHAHTHVRTHARARTHTHIHVHAHTDTHLPTHPHTHTHTCAHTHTHTHPPSPPLSPHKGDEPCWRRRAVPSSRSVNVTHTAATSHLVSSLSPPCLLPHITPLLPPPPTSTSSPLSLTALSVHPLHSPPLPRPTSTSSPLSLTALLAPLHHPPPSPHLHLVSTVSHRSACSPTSLHPHPPHLRIPSLLHTGWDGRGGGDEICVCVWERERELGVGWKVEREGVGVGQCKKDEGLHTHTHTHTRTHTQSNYRPPVLTKTVHTARGVRARRRLGHIGWTLTVTRPPPVSQPSQIEVGLYILHVWHKVGSFVSDLCYKVGHLSSICANL